MDVTGPLGGSEAMGHFGVSQGCGFPRSPSGMALG